jgi:hypothetical protein
MPVLGGMTRSRKRLLGGALAAACSSAACSAAPVQTHPASAVPSTSATATEPGTGKLVMTGPRTPTPSPDRASMEAVIATYMLAARQHRLEAMLDCFEPAARAKEANKTNSVSRALSRPTLTILSHRVTGAGGDSWVDYDGRVHSSGGIAMAVETEEAGRRETLDVGFGAVEIDGAWCLTVVQLGPDPRLF